MLRLRSGRRILHFPEFKSSREFHYLNELLCSTYLTLKSHWISISHQLSDLSTCRRCEAAILVSFHFVPSVFLSTFSTFFKLTDLTAFEACLSLDPVGMGRIIGSFSPGASVNADKNQKICQKARSSLNTTHIVQNTN